MGIAKDKAVTLIVKVTDQCNLHCGYCYYYAGEFSELRTRKHVGVGEKLNGLAEAIENSVYCAEAESVYIVLHGGEPLLAPAADIERLVNRVRSSRSDVDVSLQTNGVLVDDVWCELFARCGVNVGVSIDGPQSVHDKHRVFSNGRGSYKESVRGLKALQESAKRFGVAQPGVLAVYDPDVAARVYFEHFVGELGVTAYDLLYPDDLERFSSQRYVADAFLKTVDETWRLWLAHDDPNVYVRFIHGALASVVRNRPYMDNFDRELTLVLDLAGDAFYEDNLRTIIPRGDLTVGSWRECGIDEMLLRASKLLPVITSLHQDCKDCSFLAQCGGGPLSSRFDPVSGTFSKSHLCSVYQLGLSHAQNVVGTARLRQAKKLGSSAAL